MVIIDSWNINGGHLIQHKTQQSSSGLICSEVSLHDVPQTMSTCCDKSVANGCYGLMVAMA